MEVKFSDSNARMDCMRPYLSVEKRFLLAGAYHLLTLELGGCDGAVEIIMSEVG